MLSLLLILLYCFPRAMCATVLQMAEASRNHGKLRDKMTALIDLQNLSTKMATSSVFSVLKKRIRLEEDNYPEVVRRYVETVGVCSRLSPFFILILLLRYCRVLLVRAPKAFSFIWGLCSSFLDKGTLDKVCHVTASVEESNG